MARASSVATALALLGALAATAPATAQGLRTLHVDALSMRADRQAIPVGATFHVAIHVHVREHVDALDELVVPDIGTMQPLGDERTVTHANGGTDVVETLTLAPTQPGSFTFRPAYLDAIDGRTGRPSRFSSNPLRVTVVAVGGSPVDAAAGALRQVALVVAILVGVAVVVLLALALVRIGRTRTRASVTVAAPVPQPPPAPAAPPRTSRDEVAAALRRYRTAPANGELRDLRAALFVAAGVAPGATLRDALQAQPGEPLRSALLAAERAAFGAPGVRDAASAELIGATERWLR
ncbi:MAG: hypothetical protein ABSD03_02950 [Vulcanimicrobiaceae bacterium]